MYTSIGGITKMRNYDIERYALLSYFLGIFVMIYTGIFVNIIFFDTRFFIIGIILLPILGLNIYGIYKYKLRLRLI